MARIRTIKPSIRRSRTVCGWPYDVRWTFNGLFTYLDDDGRGEDDARLLKAELYPLDDDMTLTRIEQHLRQIRRSGGPLCRYTVDGRTYMHITSWSEHQHINRPTPSTLPPCPTHDGSLSTPGGKGREGKGRERKGTRTREPETPIPDDFPLTEQLRETGARHGMAPTVIADQFAAFCAWHGSHGTHHADWTRTWLTWVLRWKRDQPADRGDEPEWGR
jgi:hypothetical protein